MEANYFGSESSSGCESGWTLYLEQSHSLSLQHDFICKHQHTSQIHYHHDADADADDEEDMSMVSDASSGPQHHFPQQEPDEDQCFNFNNNNNSINNVAKTQKFPRFKKKIHDLPNFLDDTASSPFFNFSNKNNLKVEENDIIDYSQGYSTTYFKGKSAFEDHFGFYQPVTGAQLQQNQWLEEKRW
ncbi:hypothetical protein QVD17_05798 [Tagetes erecta]|uniref:Uncharacterized protein n=1 Tax=Tagetes erecta TaxID=13708 RepID=A0AAD8LI76_TARER|nr:hypothetical protein QVD17_05798 [Tagetes erecta]